MTGRRASQRKRIRGELIGLHGEPVIFVAGDPISRTGARAGRLLLSAQRVTGPMQRARVAADMSRQERER